MRCWPRSAMSATCRPRTARSIPSTISACSGRSTTSPRSASTTSPGAIKGADKLILATDPDREGEAISWHVLEVLKEQHAIKEAGGRAGGVQRHHQEGGARCDEAPARASTARWSMPISRAAPSITSSASPSRRCCGASCRARARPAGCSRWRCASSATASSKSRNSSRGNTGRWWRRSPRRATIPSRRVSSAPTAGRSSVSISARAPRPKPSSRRWRTRALRSPISRPSPPSAIRRPPFTTSTLQQEASRKLGFAPAHTMRIAQRLYEGVDIDGETVGLITYMRTDGVDIAEEAIAAARSLIGADYGAATSRPRRASTRPRRRTRRRRTRRSGRPMWRAARRTPKRFSIPIRPGSTS